MTQNGDNKPSGFTSFLRYNVAAIIATSADFITLLFLKEILGLNYVLSTCIAATVGAIIAFSLGRYWAFVSTEVRKSKQFLKYATVAAGSILLNTIGVFLVTDYITLDYKLSKVIVAGFIVLFYNYPLSKNYTFK
jgi:putative flippase GtrA